jgi:hypothetical protein
VKAALRRLAAVAMLLPLACIAGELDSKALERSIRGLHSHAQETLLLMRSARDAQVTAAYARVQREELRGEVRETAKPLDDAAPAHLAQRAARARTLTEKLVAVLRDDDAANADAVARDLAGLAKGGP